MPKLVSFRGFHSKPPTRVRATLLSHARSLSPPLPQGEFSMHTFLTACSGFEQDSRKKQKSVLSGHQQDSRKCLLCTPRCFLQTIWEEILETNTEGQSLVNTDFTLFKCHYKKPFLKLFKTRFLVGTWMIMAHKFEYRKTCCLLVVDARHRNKIRNSVLLSCFGFPRLHCRLYLQGFFDVLGQHIDI